MLILTRVFITQQTIATTKILVLQQIKNASGFICFVSLHPISVKNYYNETTIILLLGLHIILLRVESTMFV